MSNSGGRYVIQVRLLGLDDSANKKRKGSSNKQFAMDVTLSDESSYVIFRTIKEITTFHTKLVAQFPVEAGYFNKKENIIPECPLKMTIFGPSRVVREDRVFEKMLNSYIKELPAMPPSIVKCDIINNFFKLRTSDMSEPGEPKKRTPRKKRRERVVVTDDSKISGPMSLRSYYAVTAYTDPKTKFSFAEGAVIQVLQKDTSGWWMVDASGKLGWAPASYLVPLDDGDLAEEAKENEKLMDSITVGARYISKSAYQASRDDEISFVGGAVVTLVKKYADGWWLVRYNGGEGFVPGAMFNKFDRRQDPTYVKNIRRKFRSQKSRMIIPTIKPKWMTDPSSAPTGGLMLYQCLTRYTASNSTEISLNKDDIVKVRDKKDHGWWFVEDKHGRAGWAPATYLGPVVDRAKQASNPSQNSIVGSTREVKQSYTSKQGDELSVARGDKVTVLSAPDDGWWVVCNMSSMEQGLIPSVCLTETAGPAEELPSELQESIKEMTKALAEQEDHEDEEAEVVKEEDKEDEEDEQTNSDGYSYGSEGDVDDILLDGNSYTAISDYSSQAQDELSVSQGQMVCVVDDSDESMFYVVVDGQEGWVPSNVLRLSRGRYSVSSNSSYSLSYSKSHSPSPYPSRSPSPMELSNFVDSNPRDFAHQHSTPNTPASVYLKPQPRRATHQGLSHDTSTTDKEDEEVAAINTTEATSSDVLIHVEEMEQAALQAEQKAKEAQSTAAQLRERAQIARRSYTPKDDSD